VKAWLDAWRRRRATKAQARRAIPDGLWQLTLARLPFLAERSDQDLSDLRKLTSEFLDQKEFTGANGLMVDDAMAVCIAAQAALPVLHMGLAPYRDFVGIVVQPDEVRALREWEDDDGIVHTGEEVLSGEAMAGGPVMLSWVDVSESGQSAEWGYNVVIHEFAHVIDMRDGQADGVPPMPDREARAHWLSVIEPAYSRFCATVEDGHDTVLDPYGATSIDEFFAVACEAFFVNPKKMRAEHADVYGLLARYFAQDPAAYDG
jgi:hypothetical protein